MVTIKYCYPSQVALERQGVFHEGLGCVLQVRYLDRVEGNGSCLFASGACTSRYFNAIFQRAASRHIDGPSGIELYFMNRS